MKKRFSRERIQYWFDCIMGKGPIAMTILLLGVVIVFIGVISIVSYFVADEGNVLYQFWMSMLHTLDPGTIAGDETTNVPYLLFMFIATLFGLFVTSILIGIITTGVENKFRDLRKGTSIVQEKKHTVIIGFNHNTFDLLHELIEANANKKKACVVILCEQPKEEIEDIISARITDQKSTRIICRTGNLHESYSFQRCAVENSHSVIVNIQDDADTIKTVLALSTYLKDKELYCPGLKFVVAIDDKQYIEAVNIAGEGRAEVLYTKDVISRIIANTCRQHGLSQVLTEFFNYGGNELYFEDVPSMVGKTFKEAMLCFSNAMVVGLCLNNQTYLNPPMDTVITKDAQLILLEDDDGSYKVHERKEITDSLLCEDGNISMEISDNLLVLGSNDKLPIILSEYNQYVNPNTSVIVVDDNMDEDRISTYENLHVTVCKREITRDLLCEFLDDNVNNILILNDDSEEAERSDSYTLLRLILLRDIADKNARDFSITTEMRSADNQRLASQARVDDFVIGSNFASLLMVQISENHMMKSLIEELLDESGSELYMKPVANYVSIGQPVDSYVLTESAARKGEIYIGYRHMGAERTNVVVNPSKEDEIVFGEYDQIVVIAEN